QPAWNSRGGRYDVPAPGRAFSAAGVYHLVLTLWDGLTRLVRPLTVTVGPWRATADRRSNDPQRAELVPLGEAAVAINTGGLRLSDALDFDQSPGTAVGRDPALVYNSDTVDVHPIIEFTLPALP